MSNKLEIFVFQNPKDKKQIDICTYPWVWTLLFCPFYFMSKSIWTHGVISLIVSIFLPFVPSVIYAFGAKDIVRKHYRDKGWNEVDVPILNQG